MTREQTKGERERESERERHARTLIFGRPKLNKRASPPSKRCRSGCKFDPPSLGSGPTRIVHLRFRVASPENFGNSTVRQSSLLGGNQSRVRDRWEIKTYPTRLPAALYSPGPMEGEWGFNLVKTREPTTTIPRRIYFLIAHTESFDFPRLFEQDTRWSLLGIFGGVEELG